MRSVYDDGIREAQKHKWIESEKCGCDRGQAALDEWFRVHWCKFCRSKLLHHLAGRYVVREFAAEDFGLIPRLVRAGDLLLELILDRAEAGFENLDLINWAWDWNMPMQRVIDILEQLDLNRARLDPTAPPHYAESTTDFRCSEKVAV